MFYIENHNTSVFATHKSLELKNTDSMIHIFDSVRNLLISVFSE